MKRITLSILAAAALASAPASAGFYDTFVFGNAEMGGYDGDARRAFVGSAVRMIDGVVQEDWGSPDTPVSTAKTLDGGVGQDSAYVFKNTEGGSGIYHAGTPQRSSVSFPKDAPPPPPPGMGGGDSGGTGGYKGGDGGVYSSAEEAAAHGGNYGYRSNPTTGAAHSSVSGTGNSAMDAMNGF